MPKQYSPTFKAKISLKVLKGQSVEELALQYDIAPSMIYEWEHIVVANARNLFEGQPSGLLTRGGRFFLAFAAVRYVFDRLMQFFLNQK